jgi:hypothetical protein
MEKMVRRRNRLEPDFPAAWATKFDFFGNKLIQASIIRIGQAIPKKIVHRQGKIPPCQCQCCLFNR